MSRGKFLSLEEARNSGKIKRFAKEHSSEGSKKALLETIGRMVHGNKGKKESGGKS